MSRKPFKRKDSFYHKAKKEGYPARSAYKIIEMDNSFQIFKTGYTVIDLGCAPGGWLKVAQEKMGNKGTIIGIDLLPLNLTLNQNTFFLQDDFTKKENQEKIKTLCPKGVGWVISDLSPNITGIKFKDTQNSYELSHLAFEFALNVLKPNGGFLCKLFPGPETDNFKKEMQTHFTKVTHYIPDATRSSSVEIYLVGTRFKGLSEK